MAKMSISRNKDNTGCALLEVEGQQFFIPCISMSYVRPQWAELGGKSMFDLFTEAEAELVSPSSVKLIHSQWDDELVLHANEYRTVQSFGSGTFYSTFRGMTVQVFKSVRDGTWDCDKTHENW